MNGISSTTALWYASRATGVVSLLLLSAVMILGMLVNRQGRLPGLPRFGATMLHRNISLLSVAFVAVHVITALADPFVTIGAVAVIAPFTSAYEPFWLGLGAVSLDMMIALIVTSLVRARMSRRAWRAVHWLAYAAWPVAFAHSIGSSTDLRHGGLFDLAVGCAAAVGAAAGWRVSASIAAPRRSQRAARALADAALARRPDHAARH
jgi:methionine sulfoxide reductase heme-binding subunit